MTAKHTPGPWTTGRAINAVDMGKFSFICPFGANSANQVAEIKANACLISSAPDLLAALEDAEFLLRKASQIAGPMRDSFNRSAKDARSAIAKAKGE